MTDANGPSAFQRVTYRQDNTAMMWGREAKDNKGAWTHPDCWIFDLAYSDGITAEIRIRKLGFTREEAKGLASKYGKLMGQLPACLREGTDYINIMKGNGLFGGNNSMRSIDITIGQQSAVYGRTGNMEEILFHEATHAALDYLYQKDWAQHSSKDPFFISKYAADFPVREDIAETFLVYAAYGFGRGRLTRETISQLAENIPNRLAYFHRLGLNMHPMDMNKETQKPELFAADGRYRLINYWVGEGKSLDILNDGENTQPLLTGTANTTGQLWEIRAAGPDLYTLSTVWRGNGQVLTVIREGNSYGAVLRPANGANSLWKIMDEGDGYFRIISAAQPTLSIDILNNGENNRLQLSESGNYSGQLWKVARLK